MTKQSSKIQAASNEGNLIPFWQALRFWLKLGFISFGGPAGQIAIMHQELVERKRWISEKRFLHALNFCMVLPGPEAQQLATYIGWLMHRSWGGLVAGLLFILPSLFLLIFLSWAYIAFGDLTVVAGLFYGIKPAVTAIVFHAAHRIGSRTLTNPLLWLIAIAAFIAIFVFHLPFPFILLGAAALGFLGNRFAPQYFHRRAGTHGPQKSYGAACIDDDSTIPEHALFRWSRLFWVAIIGLLCWLLPMVLLLGFMGWNHPFTQMAWFFTKAALLTFGGAYAVLPYVYQGAVGYYNWLTPTQMIDGLALGETTPGPLIMVVVFVAFASGFLNSISVGQEPLLAGIMAAIIVTWFTFLPSFIFIFAGAPLIETTHNQLQLTAPLTAITAAVVGVIVNLALFFGYHVLWPQGFDGGLEVFSAVLTLATFVLLFRFNWHVIKTIAFSAVLGLLFYIWRQY